MREGLNTIVDYNTAKLNPVIPEIAKDWDRELQERFRDEAWWQKFMATGRERFWKAPASGQVKFHGAWIGGLAAHSAMVHHVACSTAEGLLLEGYEELFLKASLFHDLGKVGMPTGPDYFILEKSDWHRKNLGRLWTNNEEYHASHEDLSMMWCNYLGVPLDLVLTKMILHHDIFRDVRAKAPTLYTVNAFYWIFSFADNYVTKIFKT